MSEIAKVITAGRYAQGFTFQGYLDSIGANRSVSCPHRRFQTGRR